MLSKDEIYKLDAHIRDASERNDKQKLHDFVLELEYVNYRQLSPVARQIIDQAIMSLFDNTEINGS